MRNIPLGGFLLRILRSEDAYVVMSVKKYTYMLALCLLAGCSGKPDTVVVSPANKVNEDWRNLPYLEKREKMAPIFNRMSGSPNGFEAINTWQKNVAILNQISEGDLNNIKFTIKDGEYTEKVLPRMFFSLKHTPSSEDQLDEEVSVLKPHFDTEQEYYNYLRLRHSLFYLRIQNFREALKWIYSQSNHFPPSKFDVFISWELLAGNDHDVIGRGNASPDAEIATAWKFMSKSKNPIYRLIAVAYANYLLSPEDAATLSKQALLEQDEIFKEFARQNLEALSSPNR